MSKINKKKPKVTCIHCEKTFARNSIAEKHIKNLHEFVGESCPVGALCDRRRESFKGRDRCTDDALISTKEELAKHFEKREVFCGMNRCTQTHWTISDVNKCKKAKLNRKIRNPIISIPKNFVCPICSKALTDKSSLKTHQKSSARKVSACEKQKKKFHGGKVFKKSFMSLILF